MAAIAGHSNDVLRDLGPDVQWVYSHVADDKIFCFYLATGEDIIREHARRGGFPIHTVHEVRATMDPTTADLSGSVQSRSRPVS